VQRNAWQISSFANGATLRRKPRPSKRIDWADARHTPRRGTVHSVSDFGSLGRKARLTQPPATAKAATKAAVFAGQNRPRCGSG
jgi:hypothetical protein